MSSGKDSARTKRAAANTVTMLMVPGLGNSGPEHWQSIWEHKTPGVCRVQQQDWARPIPDAWVHTLHQTISTIHSPVVLVGHSAGTMAIVYWAARFQQPIHGALLVAPVDYEAQSPNLPPRDVLDEIGWTPVPRHPLPLPSILVASTTDPWISLTRAEYFAQQWGCQFVNIGDAGHINAVTGFGPWPEGEALLQKLI